MQPNGDGHTEDDAAWKQLQQRVQDACRSVSERPESYAGVTSIPKPPPLPRVDVDAVEPSPGDFRASFTPVASVVGALAEGAQPAGSSVAPVALDPQERGDAPVAEPRPRNSPGWRSLPMAAALTTMGALLAFGLYGELNRVSRAPAAISGLSAQLAQIAGLSGEAGRSAGAGPIGASPSPAGLREEGAWQNDAASEAPALADASQHIGVPVTVITVSATGGVGAKQTSGDTIAGGPPLPEASTPAPAPAARPQPAQPGAATAALEAMNLAVDWQAVQEGSATPGSTALLYRETPRTQVPSTEQQIRPTRLEPDRASARGRLRVP